MKRTFLIYSVIALVGFGVAIAVNFASAQTGGDIPENLAPLAQELGCSTKAACEAVFNSQFEKGLELAEKYQIYDQTKRQLAQSFKQEILSKLADVGEEEFEERVVELARNIVQSRPTLARQLQVANKDVQAADTIVKEVKNAGADIRTCSQSADSLSREELIACLNASKRLAERIDVVKDYVSEERLAQKDFNDAALGLEEALARGEYRDLGSTADEIGTKCLRPGSPSTCDDIARRFFGPEGVAELTRTRAQVANVQDQSKKNAQKLTLTLSDGRAFVGKDTIRNLCDEAFGRRDANLARSCGDFAVRNGFANQKDVDEGLKLLESFTQKSGSVDFRTCERDFNACRDYLPDDRKGEFQVMRQISEIMRAEIGFNPEECDKGQFNPEIGKRCFEGAKRALPKIEQLASASPEAQRLVAEIRGHIAEGEQNSQRQQEIEQVVRQGSGPGGCRTPEECSRYCSDSSHGPECISFGAKYRVFEGQEAVERFQRYNNALTEPYYGDGSQRGGFPGQGPYPGFQPPGQGGVPPGQTPGFTSPGPGFYPPYGQQQGGPVGPSPECFAAIQSGDYVRAKTICAALSTPYVPQPPRQVVCPALYSVDSCPAGQNRVVSYSSPECGVFYRCEGGQTPPQPPQPPPPGTRAQCSDGVDNDNDGKIDYPADPSCYGGDDNDEFYPPGGTGTQPPYYGDTACQELESLISGCHSMSESPNARFDSSMTRYVIVGTREVKNCSTNFIPGCSGTSSTGGGCLTELIGLLGSGCHYMYNDSSGRAVYCDGPMSKSAKAGDTTAAAGCSSSTSSGWPTDQAGCSSRGYFWCTSQSSSGWCQSNSCPTGDYPPGTTDCATRYGSGWHPMDSSGNCFNSSMTEYKTSNGTLYQCSSTPATGCSTGTPTPVPSGCTAELISLLGSGCHQMYSDSSGNQIYCDGAMTKSAKRGDTATTPSCTSPGSTPYQPPSGQREQVWNSLGLRSYIRADADQARIDQLKQACSNVSSSANVWLPGAGNSSSVDFGMPDSAKCQRAASCTAGQYFDGANCVGSSTTTTCPSGQYWNGSACVTSTTSTSCPTGQYWNGSSCVTSTTTSSSCPSFAHEMSGYCMLNSDTSRCAEYSTASSESGYTTAVCQQHSGTTSSTTCPSGQYWNGSSCVTSTTSTSCPTGQYWNGTACVSSTSTSSCSTPSTCYDSAVCASSGWYWYNSGCWSSPQSSTPSSTCPSGYHSMGGYCMSDSDASTCQPTGGGATYSCSTTSSPSTTTTTSCPSNQYWNGSACVNSTTTSTTCPTGQYWNGTACVNTSTTDCPSGQYWNGSACATSSPPPSSYRSSQHLLAQLNTMLSQINNLMNMLFR